MYLCPEAGPSLPRYDGPIFSRQAYPLSGQSTSGGEPINYSGAGLLTVIEAGLPTILRRAYPLCEAGHLCLEAGLSFK